MLIAVDEHFRRSLIVLFSLYCLLGASLIVGLVFLIRRLARRYLHPNGHNPGNHSGLRPRLPALHSHGALQRRSTGQHSRIVLTPG
jgi:hypothetical protein